MTNDWTGSFYFFFRFIFLQMVPPSVLAALLVLHAVAGALAVRMDPTPTSSNCTARYFTQDLDHFNWGHGAPGGATSYSQR
jgi:hypothetical protein